MPPVLSPRSPSNARLWSCAPGMHTLVVPSQKASTDTSSPSSSSSTTTSLPASPNARSTMIFSRPATASCTLPRSGMSTPLPAAKPDAFSTTGYDTVLTCAQACTSAGSERDGAARKGAPRRTFETSCTAQ
jgi:hypothetical protein